VATVRRVRVRGTSAVTLLEHVVATSTKKRPGTRSVYQANVRAFLDFVGVTHNTLHTDFTGADVERWRDALLARGLSPRTVNGKLAAIKFASKRLDALDHGHDFAKAVEFLPVVIEKKRFAPTIERGRRLVDGCCGALPIDLRDRALIVIALRTGCRREGLAELQLVDIEPGASAMTVVIKGGRRHRIALDLESRAALSAWLVWLTGRGAIDGYVFRSLRRGISGWVIGDRLHASSVNLIFNKRAMRSNAGHWFPHLARHSFVSWADGAGVPRTRIANVTGHQNLDGLSPYLSDVDGDTDPVGQHLPSLVDTSISPR
jgi:integrase